MGRFLRRKQVSEGPPEEQSFWQVPARYNFTRDVVEAYASDPLRPALTFVDRDGVIDRRTFADIATDAGRWAGLLRSRGLDPGDRLLVVVALNRAWHGIMLGALKAGLVPIPCPASLDVAEIHRRARDSEARIAVVEADRASEIWQPGASLAVVVVEEVELELREVPAGQPTNDTAAEDEALILYTSGTTGDPKGTILTHASTWAARIPAEHWLDARTGDLVWCTLGKSWALSIWSILFYPWSRGAESVLHDADFDAEQRFDLLQRLGVTVLCQSPTEYRLLTEAPWISRYDLGRLRHAVSSGERLELETITAFRKVFDVTIHDGYGQAENPLLVANARGTAVKPGSMGLPLPGHQIAVLDEEGNELPPDVEGDLALRGTPPTLFAGYVDGTAEVADVFRGEWYLTGDRATWDADGYVWFTGRGAPLREIAAERARAAEAREAEILALENASSEDAVAGESARMDDAMRRKQKRAAADTERAEAEAAARAERRSDLARRTAAALAADEERRERDRRQAEAEAEAEEMERARLEAEREAERHAAEAAEAARLQAEAAQREQERREAEAALAEERARRDAEAAEREEERRAAEAAEVARLEAIERERERRDAEAALAEERSRREAEAVREREEAEARAAAAVAAAAAAAAAPVDAAEPAPEAPAVLSGRAARKEQQRLRKEEERARKEAERRRKEEERARKDAERKQQEEERAAAERRKREDAEEQRAAAERARQAEQRRREDEKQRREEQKAAEELARREAEVRQRASRAEAEAQRAEAARLKAEEEERRKEEERRRKAEEKQRREEERKRGPAKPGETVAEPGDEGFDDDRPNAELIARLRAYGLRQPDDGSDE